MKNYFQTSIFILFSFSSTFSQQFGSIKDPRDGKIYKTVKIGQQMWMAENLNTYRFRNGDVIKQVKTSQEWNAACFKKEPVWMYYNGISSNENKFGIIYNYYAVMDKRGLAPEGCHIPFKNEFDLLSQYSSTNFKSASGWFVYVYKCKVLQNVDKIDRNGFPYVDLDFVETECRRGGSGNNISGFNALPAGYVNNSGVSVNLSREIGFWSSTQSIGVNSYGNSLNVFRLTWDGENPEIITSSSHQGFYVRCVFGKSLDEIQAEMIQRKKHEDSLRIVQEMYRDSVNKSIARINDSILKNELREKEVLYLARKNNAAIMDSIDNGIVYKISDDGERYLFSKLFSVPFETSRELFAEVMAKEEEILSSHGFRFPEKNDAEEFKKFYKDPNFRKMFYGSELDTRMTLNYVNYKSNYMYFVLYVGKYNNPAFDYSRRYFFGVKSYKVTK